MLILLCPAVGTTAQITNTGYFMKSHSNRTAINPALRPEQAYLGMPLVLNNLYVDVKTNTLNMDHLTFPANGDLLSFMHKDVPADKFLSGISANNYLNADVNYSLFSLGWYKGDGFWNVNMNIKAHGDANIPYPAFELLKKGFAMNEPTYYNVKDTRITANAYTEIGVGHSRPFLNNTLTVGAKAKLLLGFADIDVNIRELNVEAGMDEWVVRSHATMKASAPGIYPIYDEEGDFDSFDWKKGFGIPGVGFGFDVGATYSLAGLANLTDGTISDILQRLNFSLAFTDLGLISWGKRNTSHLSTRLEDEVITGNFVIDFEDSSSLENDLEKIKDTLEEILNFKEDEKKNRATGLRTNMNIGLDYEFLKDKLSAGVLSTTHFNTSRHVTEFTLGVSYRPVKWFETALSYSFIHSNFDTFGFAMNFTPTRGVHFFLASDYIIPHVNSEFIPVTSKGINLQLGLSIPLGRKPLPASPKGRSKR